MSHTMWNFFHTYTKLIDAGKVPPLLCPDCNIRLVTYNRDGLPAWRCVGCISKFVPTIKDINTMKENMNEFSSNYEG